MRRRPRLPVDPPELNLVPLLDMVSLLIQMLLVSAQFGVYAEVDAHVAGGAAAPEGEPLAFEVAVTDDGFSLSWTAEGGRVGQEVACAGGCAAGGWDGDGLLRAATALKAKHPKEVQVVIRPADGVPFQAVVTAMDALRGDPAAGPLFPDLVFSP